MLMKIRLTLVVILLFGTNIIEAKVTIYTDDSPENGSNNYLGYKVPSADEMAESWVQSQIYQNKEEESYEMNHDEDKPQVSRESFPVGKNWMIKKYCVSVKDDKNCMEIGMKEGRNDFPVRIRIRSQPITKNKTLVSQEMENKDELSQKKMAITYRDQNIQRKNQNRLRKKKRSLYADDDNVVDYEYDENYHQLEENRDEDNKPEEEPKRDKSENNENNFEASNDDAKNLTKRKLAKSGIPNPYLDSNPSKPESIVISAGPYQWNKCKVPDSAKNAQILCKKWNTAISCNLYCAHGHTFKEGIKRETHCKFNKGKWTKKFEECKAFMDCTLQLKGGGSFSCVTNRLKDGIECQISCTQQGENDTSEKRTYTCSAEGRWKPALPHCVESEGIDTVDPPEQKLEHELIEYPKKYPFSDGDID